MLALEMGSERACAMGIAAVEVGVEGDPQRVSGDGLVVTNWERWRTRMGAMAATLRRPSLDIASQAAPRPQRGGGTWRTAMASAFMLVLGAHRDSEAVRSAIIAAGGIRRRRRICQVRHVADARRQILAKPVARISGQNRIHQRSRVTV